MAITKEIRFLLSLFELAQERGDVYAEVAVTEICEKMGITVKASKNVINQLAGANFVKKRGQDYLVITDNGLRLAEEWL